MTTIDLPAWLAEHRDNLARGETGTLFAAPLRVMVIPGRGPRADFHRNTVAELFYQLDGDISVIERAADGTREIPIRTGELWVAEPGVPHSPQRPVGSVGLVVEPARDPGTTESFEWYCGRCDALLHELVVPAGDGAAMRRGMADFHA